MGGGGRGMRVAHGGIEARGRRLDQAQREAGTAFGASDVFLEKYVQRARHIEVQLLGDKHGNLIHLFERDCSVQRRHPEGRRDLPLRRRDLPEATAEGTIWDAAIKVGKAAGEARQCGDRRVPLRRRRRGSSTSSRSIPRIQVEHTVTEQITGYDIVRQQILIASGESLRGEIIAMAPQDEIRSYGFAVQCRVTSEDPANKFIPDYGRLSHYRSAGGPGIRLDAGSAFTGAVITPFYDSLLVKVTAHGIRFQDALRRMERCLQEFRIRGVKTNIPFLINLVNHPTFKAGGVTTRFLDDTPDLFELPFRQDRATKVLTYLADVIVNGHHEPNVRAIGMSAQRKRISHEPAPLPKVPKHAEPPAGSRTKFKELGPEKFSKWILDQKRLLLTDTTFRDAHQSLLATRMRTHDMLAIAPVYAHRHAGFFSLETWGGATFDTSMRFLKEDPWQRLFEMRSRIPNILMQMLLRASSVVGYTNYPDNVLKLFIKEAWAGGQGVDLFRIFDALNWIPNMRLAVETVREVGGLAEAAICYTGDILDPKRDRYTLAYYVEIAKQLEKLGASLLCIKDMAGLLKPYAAKKLVHTLRQEIGIPIHLHTHDSSGGQIATLVEAAEQGVHIVDAAMGPLSCMTSQVNLNTLVEALRFTERDTGFDFDTLRETADYWQAVRGYYLPFETGLLSPSADVYRHEMPGGQYTNLFQQAQSIGLEAKWPEVVKTYADVNRMFGDIVKVTPTSKVVGDMAIFMIANNLTPSEVINGARELAFPESVVEFFEGRLGQPVGGFPKDLQARVLKGKKPMTERPGSFMPPVDLEAARTKLAEAHKHPVDDRELVTHLLYGRVSDEFHAHQATYSDVGVLPTPAFFYGLDPGEEISVDIEEGKTLIIKFLTVGDPHLDGRRLVFFELNGQPREVLIHDKSLGSEVTTAPQADPAAPKQVGAPMPGLVVRVNVAAGETVTKGQKLFTLEAMKMETTVYAELAGKVADVLVKAGSQVETADLMMMKYEG